MEEPVSRKDIDRIQQLKDQKGSIKGDYLGKYYRAIYLILKNMEGLTALRSIC